MLKYLFIVRYKDGSLYEQNEQDVSITDSKRSCFFDVRQDEIDSFYLINAEHSYAVFLDDGRFEIDGTPFWMHDSGIGFKDFKLVFYRQHEHDFNIGMKEVAHRIRYCMGWQSDSEGYNIKRIMEFT